MDVTVGGFAGKAITLHVPMSFDLPNASRDVNGSIVILDAPYGPAAPSEVVAELRSLAESATFK